MNKAVFESMLRKFVSKIILEEMEKDILGEPDESAESERMGDEEKDDADEASTLASVGSLGPNMSLSYDPEKPG